MKKALAFLMAAVMLMSMLTACGNKDVADDTKDNNVSTTEATQATADTKDNTDAPTAEIADTICIGDNRCLYYCFPKKGCPVAKTRLAAEELYKLCKAGVLAK